MSDRTILITGVSGAIGRFLARVFLDEGWVVAGLDQKPLPEGDWAGLTFEHCDLTNPAETGEKIDLLHGRLGAFNAVVNCAGLIANAPLLSLVDGRLAHHDLAMWDRTIASNLSSAFYVTAPTVLKMVSSGKKGVVINISSVCSAGNAGQSAYSAAKAGLNAMTRALAKELGPFGVRVVALAPGYFDTASTRENVPPNRLKDIQAAIPLRRLGQLQDLAAAVRFIIENPYVTGKVIEIDGGLVI